MHKDKRDESRDYDFNEAFKDPWLRAEDLQGRSVTLKITDCRTEKHRLPSGLEDECHVLSFAKTDKRYILNLTNALVLMDLWGPHGRDYVGHSITMEPVPDPSGKSRSGEKILFTGTPEIEAPVTVRQPKGETREIRPTRRREKPADEGQA